MGLQLAKFRGDPCQAATAWFGRDDPLCSEPAEFLYIGIWPDNKRYLKLGIMPVRALLCVEHARGLMTEFGWAIKDGECEVLRLSDVQRLTANCGGCLTISRVEILGRDTVKYGPSFCPNCGERAISMPDPERDFWDVMSESFDGMSLELLKMLYNDWQQTRTYPRFRDYIENALAEGDDEV